MNKSSLQSSFMSEREYKQAIPPYISYRSFSDGLEYLRKNGVPRTMDKTSFGKKMSQSAAVQFISALRFLGLLMVDDQPTLELSQLAKSSTKNPKAIMRRVLKQSYTSIFELDLKTITPKKLTAAFLKFGAEDIVAGKCVTFFTHVAFDAEIPLAPKILPGVRKTTAKPRKKEKPAATGQIKTAKINVTLSGDETTKWLSKSKFKLHPMLLGLLKELPEAGSVLPAKQKATLKRYFEAMLDIIYKKEE
jgi:hypothetical protein